MTDAFATANSLTAAYRVRFDECTPDAVARTSALLRYAQDVARVHSDRLGFDRAWYLAHDVTWVVRTAELSVLGDIPLGETVAVSTIVIGFRRVWARRRTEVRLADGTLAAWAHTDWVVIGPGGVPGRVPAEIVQAFAGNPAAFEPGRVTLPPTPADAVTWRSGVRASDLDPLAHVNNAAYLDYLEESILAAGGGSAAWLARTPRTVRIEYLASAPPAADLVASAWPAGDGRYGWCWRLADAAGRELARATYTHDGGDAR